MSSYDVVAGFVSKVKNARFGETVQHVEDMLDAGDWRDFTIPAGKIRYQFGSHEFDYFLVVQGIDAQLVRTAYASARDVEKLAAKEMRLSDVTGRGETPPEGSRRKWQDVAKALAGDPFGAGDKIAAAGKACLFNRSGSGFVTANAAEVAGDPERRKLVKQGETPYRWRVNRWEVKWSDDRTPPQAIVDKLLNDPDLAREVYKRLDAARAVEKRRTVSDNKRRSA
jgi:hypothetical protein